MIDSWIKISNFPHSAGSHCESTTLRDHLNFLGFPHSESMVFGLDATMGFVIWDQGESDASLIIGGKQGNFNETSLACRLLGIIVEKRTFQRPQEAWQDSKNCLNREKPLVIQADIGYLPYMLEQLKEKEKEIHFGGHLLSIIGYEQEHDIALLCDNNKDEPVETSASALMKARSSREGPRFLWPHNVRYTLEKRPDGKRPPFSQALKMSIRKVVQNMLASSSNNMGLKGLKSFTSSTEGWKPRFSAFPTRATSFLKVLYNYIQEYGTGGAIFRNLYSQFLEEIVDLPDIQKGPGAWGPKKIAALKEAHSELLSAASNWAEFAGKIKNALEGPEDQLTSRLPYQELQDLAHEIFRLEKSVFLSLEGIHL